MAADASVEAEKKAKAEAAKIAAEEKVKDRDAEREAEVKGGAKAKADKLAVDTAAKAKIDAAAEADGTKTEKAETERAGSHPTMNAYIGKKLCLISASDIRYEGIVYSLDKPDGKLGTMELTQVRSFGKEGRREVGPQIPASSEVFRSIIFNGKDIKQVEMMEPDAAPAKRSASAVSTEKERTEAAKMAAKTRLAQEQAKESERKLAQARAEAAEIQREERKRTAECEKNSGVGKRAHDETKTS